MLESEYYKAVDELGRKMLIEAKASGDKEILNSKYLKMLQDVIDHPYMMSGRRDGEGAEGVQ